MSKSVKNVCYDFHQHSSGAVGDVKARATYCLPVLGRYQYRYQIILCDQAYE